MRVAVYNRTSTSETGVTMQLKELRACSQRREWQIVEEFTDAGVAGGGHHNVGFPRRRKPRPVSRGSQTPPLLHRPVESTAFIRYVDYFRVSRDPPRIGGKTRLEAGGWPRILLSPPFVPGTGSTMRSGCKSRSGGGLRQAYCSLFGPEGWLCGARTLGMIAVQRGSLRVQQNPLRNELEEFLDSIARLRSSSCSARR
jgi:hypothetical protein